MKEKIFDKAKSKLALIFIIVVLISQKYWLFGFLFLIWAILDIKNRQTYLMEIVQRNSNPILYWIIVFMWFVFAILNLLSIYYY